MTWAPHPRALPQAVPNSFADWMNEAVTRMRMYYGEKLDIQMQTGLGQGTSFTFWIPIPESELKKQKEICQEEELM